MKHFGSKWSGAKHYPVPLADLPIFEPFAGGAGYACNYADHKVVLWEDDWNLANLWAWLILAADADQVKAIPVGLPIGTDIRTLDLTQGQMLLLKHWQRTNNVGECWTTSAWGHLPGQWTENTRARIADEIGAIKHWQIKPIDYTAIGTYFIDPPYQYNYQYRFPEESRLNYADLASKVASVPAGSRTIVCEATCPKTGAVPNYLPFVPSHRQVTSRRKATNNHHSQELVYVCET